MNAACFAKGSSAQTAHRSKTASPGVVVVAGGMYIGGVIRVRRISTGPTSETEYTARETRVVDAACHRIHCPG